MTIQTTLQPLLVWIEKNKHMVLRIDDIAKRAGYSKWYLQRAFFQATGMHLATYCRLRRLSLAALAVKYSSLTLADVAFYFQYDSLQTFIREFGRSWSMTPGDMRKKPYLEWHGFCPTLMRNEAFEGVMPVLASAPVSRLYVRETTYSVALHELDTHPVERRKAAWDEFVNSLRTQPDKIFCLVGPNSGHDRKELAIHYRYYVAVELGSLPHSDMGDLRQIPVNPDLLYAKFAYHGHYSAFRQFIQYIYNRIIPVLNMHRADGEDIEEFFLDGRSTFGNTDGTIRVNYYVPVVSDSAWGNPL